jgi:ribonuclease HI
MIQWPRIIIHTDSETAIGCLTNPDWNCKKNKSKGYVMYLDEIEWATGKMNIKYVHVKGHANIEENEKVHDRAEAQMERVRRDLR